MLVYPGHQCPFLIVFTKLLFSTITLFLQFQFLTLNPEPQSHPSLLSGSEISCCFKTLIGTSD